MPPMNVAEIPRSDAQISGKSQGPGSNAKHRTNPNTSFDSQIETEQTTMKLKITYYLDVASSWCFLAEPAWAALKERYPDTAISGQFREAVSA